MKLNFMGKYRITSLIHDHLSIKLKFQTENHTKYEMQPGWITKGSD